MKEQRYGIAAWSSKIHRARYNYVCQKCGGSIPAQSPYLRHIERLGPTFKKDPLQAAHVHLNCEAPWYQISTFNRCYNLGKLPKKSPPDDNAMTGRAHLVPSVRVDGKTTGTLLWQPPADFAKKIAAAPNTKQRFVVGALGEIEHLLQIVTTATMQVAGHPQKALELSHLITQIAELMNVTPTTPNA